MSTDNLKVAKVLTGDGFADADMHFEAVKEAIADKVCGYYWDKGEVYVKADNGKYYGFRIDVVAFEATKADLDNALEHGAPEEDFPEDFPDDYKPDYGDEEE